MPRKKTDEPESSENQRLTAPALPKTLAKQTATDSSNDTTKTMSQDEMTSAIPLGDIDNAETDRAVDDIMAEESDRVLAVEDILANKRPQITPKASWRARLHTILHSKWTWIGVAIILIILFSVPYTRYKLLGLVFKEKIQVLVIDSQNGTPVSSASVKLGSTRLKTDANGAVQLRSGVGEQTLNVTKQYYQTASSHYFVSFKNNRRVTIKLLATGRLIPITVYNKLSGKPLTNAVIHIVNTTARTNEKGQASVAVPAGPMTDKAMITLAGYNTQQISVQVTARAVPTNNFALTPSGKIYFLAKQSGTINVMKSNLDGSIPQSVVTGSGHETADTSRLLASRDWRYLVYEANRDGARPALYLINTGNDQITEFDNSNAAFSLIGWSGHNFLYSLENNSQSQWQAGSQVIKYYNADQRELNQLDQNQAAGASTSYAYQKFSDFFIAGDAVVYDTQWLGQGGYDMSNENDTIRGFLLNSQTKRDYESFPASSTGTIATQDYGPATIYFAVSNNVSGSTTYYQYGNQTIQTATINQTIFNQSNPTYFISPSGNYTVWDELSNGQDLFFTGDSSATNKRQIAALDNYSPYGWYGDSYILASRSNDQLYILPANGLSGNQQPLKITDYYEPSISNSNYEYGGF